MEHKHSEDLSMCKLVGASMDASAKLYLVNSHAFKSQASMQQLFTW